MYIHMCMNVHKDTYMHRYVYICVCPGTNFLGKCSSVPICIHLAGKTGTYDIRNWPAAVEAPCQCSRMVYTMQALKGLETCTNVLFIYTHTHTYTQIHIYIYMCVYTYEQLFLSLSLYIYMYLYVYIYIYTHVYTPENLLGVYRLNICTCVYT